MERPLRILLGLIAACGGLAAAAQETIGLQELYRLDRLPAFKDSIKLGSVSSYDRTGGNDDGFSGKYSFVRKEPEGLVLAELTGPGVIYRIWTPTPTDDVLEFLFDGESKPGVEVKFRDLFLGKHRDFPSPLAGFGAGGFYCYVPIPFEKSCLVRMRAPKVQFYQINYALYAPGASVTSFHRARSDAYELAMARARELFGSAGQDISQFACPPGGKLLVERTAVAVPPRGTATLFKARKGGRIVGLRLMPAEAFTGKTRDLLLKIAFDGPEPAVLCPAGDFFGYAWGQPAMRSLLVGTAGNTNYCYFPMPFEHNATIQIVSERPAAIDLKAEVVYCNVPRQPTEGTFNAIWRRENPTQLGQPFTFLDTRGRGHLVGVVLQAQGFESGKTLFFEGDDQTTIDGELVIHGTGSEDFFNGGWYDVPDRWEKQISFPLSGCLGYAKHLGRTGAYRLFLGDAYAYRASLKQTIEHAGERNEIPTDYASVSYLYRSIDPRSRSICPPGKNEWSRTRRKSSSRWAGKCPPTPGHLIARV